MSLPAVSIPLVSIIIVNYNGGLYLLHSVAAALASKGQVDLWVVDNGSQDGSIHALRSAYGHDPRLHLIENGANLGFARANNIALRRAAGAWLLLLNPDCMLRPDTLERMVSVLAADPQAGMAGCVIRNPDGSEQAGCRRTIPTPWTGLVRALRLDRWLPSRRRSLSQVDLLDSPLPERSIYVEAISGAFMLLRRAALEQVGLLDENYFLHCEDLDWCKTFQETGWRILFVPDVEIVHHKGACSTSRPLFVLWHKHLGMVRFYRKFLSRRYIWPLNALVIGGVWLRFLVMMPLELVANLGRHDALVAKAHSLPPLAAPALPRFSALEGAKVLITGGTGFIGARLVKELIRQGARIRVLSRTPPATCPWPSEQVEVVHGDLTDPPSLEGACEGIEMLFHLASSAHMLDDTTDQDTRHRKVTELGTAGLLREAERAGVQRVVFVSSVKAMGEESDECLDETSETPPESAYGIAKRHAERLILERGQRIGIHTAILRLPMVYGPGNKGNLPRMIQAIRNRRFPPLPEVHNRRSMVHVDDTVHAMLLTAVHEQARGRIYIVTDGEVYSTAGIERLIRLELGKRPPRWTLPLGLLRLAARLGDLLVALGLHPPLHSETLRKLCGSAWYSSERIRRELGYRPRYNLPRALPEMVAELDSRHLAATIPPSLPQDAAEKSPLDCM